MAQLIDGLLAYPASLYRARWLRENPQDDAAHDDGLSFYGWSQDSAVLLRIHNLIASFGGGKDAKQHMLAGPKPRPLSRLFAPTIAEFDVAGFMEVIASGKL